MANKIKCHQLQLLLPLLLPTCFFFFFVLTTQAAEMKAHDAASFAASMSNSFSDRLAELPRTELAFFCPSEGLFADDYNCQNYYRCEAKADGYIKPYSIACREGSVFSRDLKLCMPPLLAGREECLHYTNEIDTGSTGDGDGKDDESQRLVHVSGLVVNNGSNDFESAPNQLQNYRLSGLNGVSVISFSTSSSRSSGSADVDGPACEADGFMSDPYDCTVFYRCISNGRSFNRIGFRCSEGTAWDESLQSCNHIDDVRSNGGCPDNANLLKGENVGHQTSYENSTSSMNTHHQNSNNSSSVTSSSTSLASSSSSSSLSSSSTSSSSSASSNSSQSSSNTEQQSSSTESQGSSNNQSSSGNQQESGTNSNSSNIQTSSNNQNSANNQSSNSENSNNSQSSNSNNEASSSNQESNTIQSSSNSSLGFNNNAISNSNNNSAISASSGEPNSADCKDENSYIADKYDCTKFYRCKYNGHSLEIVTFTCGPGTVWNQGHKVCGFPTDSEREKCKVMSSTGSGSENQSNQNLTTTNNQNQSSSSNQSWNNNSQTGAASSNNQSSATGNQSNSQTSSNNQESSNTQGSSSHHESSNTLNSTNNQSTTEGSNINQGASSSQSSISSQESAHNQSSSSTSSSTSNTTSHESSSSESTQSSSSQQAETSTTGNQSGTQGSSSTHGSENTQVSQGSSSSNSSEAHWGKPPQDSGICDGQTQFLSDPNDCAMFYRCVNNGKGGYSKVPFSCGVGTIWDSKINSCNHPSAVDSTKCGRPPGSTSAGTTSSSLLTTSKPTQATESPATTSKPVTEKPTSSVVVTSAGPPSSSLLTTSKPTQMTESPETISKPVTEKPTSIITSAPIQSTVCQKEGFVGDPKDCRLFYRCVRNGKGGFTQYPFECGPGTFWDDKLQTCNHDLKLCTSQNTAGTSTETHIPSTTQTVTETTSLETTTVTTAKYPDTTQQTNIPGYNPTTSATQKPDSKPVTPTSTSTQKPTTSPQTPTISSTQTTSVESVTTTTMVPMTSTVYPSKPLQSAAKCTQDGFFGDDSDCQKFYRCVANGKGGFEKYTFTCSNDTVWDAEIIGCNHPSAVQDPRCRIGSTTLSGGEVTGTTTVAYDSSTDGKLPSIQTTTKRPEYTTKYPTTTIMITESTTKYPQSQGNKTTTTENIESSTNNYTTTMHPTLPTPIPNLPPGTKCEGEGFMADPYDCRKFYRCVQNDDGFSKHEFLCAKGTGWSEGKQTCDHAGNIDRCEGQTEEPESSTTTTAGYEKPTPTTTTTTIYETTTNSFEKPTPTTISSETQKPTYRPTTTTATQSTTLGYTTTKHPILPAGVKCQGEGFMADPNDCRIFYHCIKAGDTFIKYEFTCGNGTGWSEESQTCDYIENIERCAGQTTTTTTQTSSTTTELPTTTTKPGYEPVTTTETPTTTTTEISTTSTGAPATTTELATTTTTASTTTTDISTTTQAFTTTTESPTTTTNAPMATTTESSITTTEPPTTSTQVPTTTAKTPTTTIADIPSTSTTAIPNLPAGTKCQGEGFMADPSDCRKFYRCVRTADGFIRHEFICAKGTGWSEASQTCDYIENIERCAGQTTSSIYETTTATQTSTTTTELPTTTTKPGYEPITTTETPTTTTTEISTTTTESQTTTTESPTTTITASTTTTDMSTTTQASTTTTELPTTTETPTTTTTERSTTTTEAPTTTTESPTTSTTAIPNLPAGTKCQGEGFMADPSDCRKFYRCVRTADGFIRHEFICAKGTGWSEASQTCDYIENIERCAGQTTSSIYETTTTETPTTTTTTTEISTTTTESQTTTTESPTTTTTASTTTTGMSTTTQASTTTTELPTTTKPGYEPVTTTETPTATTTEISTTTTEAPATTTEASTTTIQSPTTTMQILSTTTEALTTTTEASTTTTEVPPISTTSAPTTTSTTSGKPTTTTTATTSPPSASTNISSFPCPNTGEDQNLFVCPTGFRRHPKSCDLFYQCTEKPDSNDLNIVTFACPNNTVYSEQRNLCEMPVEDEQCQKKKPKTRHAIYESYLRKRKTIQISSTGPLCPGEGHFPLNKEVCDQLFVKCEFSEKTSRLEGHIYRCPEGYAYWAVSRRCERSAKLINCSPPKYNNTKSIPIEWLNISKRRSSWK